MTAPDRPVVVVGVDGSTGSRDAVRWAAEYARLAGAELRAVSSWRWPNYITRIPPGVDLEADTRRTLEEVVAEIRADFPEVPVGEHVVEGPGGPALLSQAADASLAGRRRPGARGLSRHAPRFGSRILRPQRAVPRGCRPHSSEIAGPVARMSLRGRLASQYPLLTPGPAWSAARGWAPGIRGPASRNGLAYR